MFEYVNGTDPTKPWSPGGWAGCDPIMKIVYLQCADVALRLLAEQGVLSAR
jgi:hypothetical protein